jgi:hypothetical protein
LTGRYGRKPRTVRKNTIQAPRTFPKRRPVPRRARHHERRRASSPTATPPANQCHFIDQKVAVTMDDFGKWMGEVGKASSALTTKADIVAALKADGEAFAAGLESMTDEKLARGDAANGNDC